jgi:hypothetical protein
MYRNLRAFFVESVLQNFKTFEENLQNKKIGISKDLRNAQTSAISQYHIAEHIYNEFKLDKLSGYKNYKEFEKHLAESDFSFIITRDLANCHKHKELDRGNPLIRDAKDITEAVLMTEYKDEKGTYRIAKKVIIAKLTDGRQIDVYKALSSNIYLWYHVLYQLGVLDKLIEEPQTVDEIPKREQDGEAARLDLEALRAEDFQLKVILQKYNYDSKRFELMKPE